MFYPEDALKKGGRFYFLWVADSWPDRFRAISYRKLCSQDIRDLCNELQEVIISESGRPSHRYSLRLSSQLLRGLVRFYQRKVSVFLNELCMLHATISKNTSKKYRVEDGTEQAPQPRASEQRRRAILPAVEPENEPRVEEILQRSSNVVANIEEITLREAVINEPVLPPNEGFGEENAEQALRFLRERRSADRATVGPHAARQSALDTTVEQMMVAPDVAQHSALDLPALDTTVQSRDRSRLAPHDAHTNMERISEHDLTALRPSDGGLLSTTGIGKEISNIPDTSIVPIPEPAPEEKQPEEQRVVEQEIPPEQPRQEAPRRRQDGENLEPTQIELEELEEVEPRAKRRRKLIIDKRIIISTDVMQARTRNPRVELRCEVVSDDIGGYIIIPCELLMGRPCHAGYKERNNMAPPLVRLFMRNLGVVHRDTRRASSTEEEEMRAQRYHTRSRLETVPEIEEPPVPAPQIQQIEPPQEMTIVEENVAPEMDLSKGPNVTETEHQDIADLPTQILRTPSQSQEAKKRPSGVLTGNAPSPKKPKSTPRTPASGSQRVLRELETNRGGYASLSEHRRLRQTSARVSHETEKLPEIDTELEKENIGMNQQIPAISILQISAMLHEAGISDRIQERDEPPETLTSRRQPEAVTSDSQQGLARIEPTIPATSVNIRPRRQGSDSSPLSGSPDRTKVSLGDSDATTDSRRFIKDHWGSEGTMILIVKCIQNRRAGEQITIRNLVERGPIIAEYKNIILAKCFTSVLKLRQHGFITYKKCPTTLEILDITFGPRLQHVTASLN